MYKQKSRDKSLNLGDSNTKYFYALFKSNMKKSAIHSIIDENGVMVSNPPLIGNAFVNHFRNILAPAIFHGGEDTLNINVNDKPETDEAAQLCRPITIEEIELAIKKSSSNKALGLDGFTAQFFKICWPLVGKDIAAAILDFF